MCSLRVSVQRTGRPVARASQATRTSSTSSPLPPKPPPTSGATTRTWSGAMPRIAAKPSRSWWGVCVDSHTVRRPSSTELGGVRARLDRARRHPLADHPARGDDLAAGEQRRRPGSRAGVHADVGPDVRRTAAPRRRAPPRGSVYDRQRVVIDLHQLRGVEPELAALGEDRRHDVAHEAHGVGGQKGAAASARRSRETAAAGRCARSRSAAVNTWVPESSGRGRGVDAEDPARGPRSERTKFTRSAPGQVEIVDVLARAGEEARILAPAHALSDDVGHSA